MNLRDLEYVVALAETGRFVAAAAKCHVSQPTLSSQVAKLEAELGVSLFERSRRGVIPSEVGREIVERARTVLQQTRELTERARGARGLLGARLRLGVIPTAGPYLLPHVLPVLRGEYPGLEIYIREALTDQLMEQLRAAELDVVVASPPLGLDGLEHQPLVQEEFVAAVPLNHPLARQSAVRPADFEHQRMLLLEEGHCMRNQTIALCEWSKAHSEVTVQATSVEGLRQMVSLGMGCTFLPKLASIGPFAAAAPTAIRPFRESPPSRTLILIWRRSHPRAGGLRELGQRLGAALAGAAEERSRREPRSAQPAGSTASTSRRPRPP